MTGFHNVVIPLLLPADTALRTHRTTLGHGLRFFYSPQETVTTETKECEGRHHLTAADGFSS